MAAIPIVPKLKDMNPTNNKKVHLPLKVYKKPKLIARIRETICARTTEKGLISME
jgi:hypothetical protein